MLGFVLEDLGRAAGRQPQLPTLQMSPSDPLQIVFTSGTTAEPKGVVITHGNVLANVGPLEIEIRKYLKYERWVHPIRFLNLLPLSHVFGQFLALYLPPLMAGTVIFQDTLNPSDVLQTVRRERISVLVAVPRMLQSLKEKIELEFGQNQQQEDAFRRKLAAAERRHYLRRWWTFRRVHRRLGWKFWAFICGGAALDSDTEEFWRRLGFPVIQGYGLTETTSLISVNHPFRLGKGSIGKILPGREVKLAEDGEILVRGGSIASARWTSGSMQPITQEEGWYRTGDIGALDADGNLYFKGRKKETIVTPAGMNIYPEDLEAALRAQPEVRDCVVVSLARGGNAEPCAVLLLRDVSDEGGPVVKRANHSLAEYQRMRVWYVWPERDFPRTSTQKPRRQVIQQMVEARMASSGKSDVSTESLAEVIANIAGREKQALSAKTTLSEDLRLSSLDRVELLSALEERYQVDLSEARFAEAGTVGEIGQLLQGTAPASRDYHYPRWALRWPVTWIRTAAYYLLVRPAIILLGWPKIVGQANLRKLDEPVLVVSNHIDDVDVGFIQTALPARLRHRLATATGGEALEALRTPPSDRGFFGKLFDRVEWTLGVALLNLFPLPREAGFRRSFAYAGEAVDQGYSILVFPEGRHTTDGELNPFRTGVGLLANNLQIPVVPMRIDGLFEIKKAGKKFALPGRIQVRIGLPVRFAAATKPEEIAAQLQKLVAEL
jgi:long-chain acyl-CoA synthetase